MHSRVLLPDASPCSCSWIRLQLRCPRVHNRTRAFAYNFRALALKYKLCLLLSTTASGFASDIRTRLFLSSATSGFLPSSPASLYCSRVRRRGGPKATCKFGILALKPCFGACALERSVGLVALECNCWLLLSSATSGSVLPSATSGLLLSNKASGFLFPDATPGFRLSSSASGLVLSSAASGLLLSITISGFCSRGQLRVPCSRTRPRGPRSRIKLRNSCSRMQLRGCSRMQRRDLVHEHICPATGDGKYFANTVEATNCSPLFSSGPLAGDCLCSSPAPASMLI